MPWEDGPLGRIVVFVLSRGARVVMKNLLVRFIQEDQGQDIIEYAYLAVFVALAATAGLTVLATNLNTEYGTLGTSVTTGS
jgi:Flp pilus assembly pilin Flp